MPLRFKTVMEYKVGDVVNAIEWAFDAVGRRERFDDIYRMKCTSCLELVLYGLYQ